MSIKREMKKAKLALRDIEKNNLFTVDVNPWKDHVDKDKKPIKESSPISPNSFYIFWKKVNTVTFFISRTKSFRMKFKSIF